MKQYIGISRDHSLSMKRMVESARKDFNSNIQSIQDETIKHGIDTIVSVVECGVGMGVVEKVITNSSVSTLKAIPHGGYIASGRSTPLYDSVGSLIEQLESVPDKDSQDVSFLIMVITDGEENSSRTWSASKLSEKIKQLEATDRWTFTFRVPRGYARSLVRDLKLFDGNVLEWDLSDRGVEKSTIQTQSGISNYYTNRSKGITRSTSFYADMSNVTSGQVKANLIDISGRVISYQVLSGYPLSIREFIEGHGRNYVKGSCYYQLTKAETVQSYKDIIILDKSSGAYYSGDNARGLLGLPLYQDIRVRLGMVSKYEIFIQSTSVNRKLIIGTSLLVLN